MSCVRQSGTTLAIEECDVFLHAEIVGDMIKAGAIHDKKGLKKEKTI